MPEITKVKFVLAVPDLKRSTDYYTSVLGLLIWPGHDIIPVMMPDCGLCSWNSAVIDHMLQKMGSAGMAIAPQRLRTPAFFR